MLILMFSIPPDQRVSSQGNCELDVHAVPMLKKAACVTACVSAVMRSCSAAERNCCLDRKQETMDTTRGSATGFRRRCGIMMRGCPVGLTPGPCSEWIGIIETSSGRWASKAAISGALHDVWPPTIAPTLVATGTLAGAGIKRGERETDKDRIARPRGICVQPQQSR